MAIKIPVLSTFSSMDSCELNECLYASLSISSLGSVTQDQSDSTSLTSATSSSTASASQSPSSSNTGAIVGGVIGAVVGASLTVLVLFFCWRRRVRSQGVRVLDLADEEGSKEAHEQTSDIPVHHPYIAVPTSPARLQADPEISADPNAFTSSSEKPQTWASDGTTTSTLIAGTSSGGTSGSGGTIRTVPQMREAVMMREMNELREEIARMRTFKAANGDASRGEGSMAEVLDSAPPPDYDEPSHSRFTEQGRPESHSIRTRNDLFEANAHSGGKDSNQPIETRQ